MYEHLRLEKLEIFWNSERNIIQLHKMCPNYESYDKTMNSQNIQPAQWKCANAGRRSRRKQGCNLSAVFGHAQAGPYKGHKQGMGLVGAALEFGMELDTHIEGAAGELHGFHNVVIGGGAADDETRVL